MELRPKPRTISELADWLGVSSMTVHRAIAGKPDIAARTRARILAEIDRLGWKPNIAARGLRQGKTFTLGVLVSNVAASFLPEILQGVDRTAEEEGYHTIVCVHEHDLSRAERHLQTMRSKGVDGIIYYPTPEGTESAQLNEVLEEIPIVVIMRPVLGFRGSVVEVDDESGGRTAARHLLERGHRRFAYLGYAGNAFGMRRRAGFVQALREAGHSLLPGWDREVEDHWGASPLLEQLFEELERPTALFCSSDRLAARALQAAASVGIAVPKELSVVGYNGDPWAEILPVPLTTIAQPRFEVGKQAARRVLADPSCGDVRDHLVLEPKLVLRGSTSFVDSATPRPASTATAEPAAGGSSPGGRGSAPQWEAGMERGPSGNFFPHK